MQFISIEKIKLLFFPQPQPEQKETRTEFLARLEKEYGSTQDTSDRRQ